MNTEQNRTERIIDIQCQGAATKPIGINLCVFFWCYNKRQREKKRKTHNKSAAAAIKSTLGDVMKARHQTHVYIYRMDFYLCYAFAGTQSSVRIASHAKRQRKRATEKSFSTTSTTSTTTKTTTPVHCSFTFRLLHIPYHTQWHALHIYINIYHFYLYENSTHQNTK